MVNTKRMLVNFITHNIRFPEEIKEDKSYHWWNPEHLPKVIEMLENNYKEYEFVQVVTRAGTGGYPSFFLMKLKNA